MNDHPVGPGQIKRSFTNTACAVGVHIGIALSSIQVELSLQDQSTAATALESHST